MSRGRASLGKSGLRAVLFARLSERSRSLQIFSPFFFPERAMWPRNCAEWNSSRVLRTGHAHASAKNRGSCEAKFFHEITLFIDRRPLPYLYSLANSFNLAWPGGGRKMLLKAIEGQCFYSRKSHFSSTMRRNRTLFNGYFHA